MIDELNALRMNLAKSFVLGLRAPESISDARSMVHAREQVQREHDSAAVAADPRSIMSAISGFRRSGEADGFRGLKYVCLGVGAVDGKGWCILADGKLRMRVAELVEQQREMRRRVRCFQALLSSYWIFPVNDRTVTAAATAGWAELRSWLRSERDKLAKSPEAKPQWFATLGRHVELLSNQPCDKFGAELLRRDFSNLNDAMEGLAIPKNSWVLEEAVFAQMKAAAGVDDESFKKVLPQLLPIAMGQGGVGIGETLRIRCVAALVSRYAKCKDRPEHMALRDAAVSTVGNPWLRRASWDAWVVDFKGRSDDQAREMINGWLKRRLISDFFELLSVDGTGDLRRLDYWLRFEPFIEDMWFALGTEAQYRRGEQFDDFRSRAKGRLLDLKETTTENNAFVMRIGEYLAVEFGASGNAFFLFQWESIGKPLMDTLTSGRARAGVSMHSLKASRDRLVHRDSAAETWEQKFDDKICPLLGRRPADPPRRVGAAKRGAASRGPTPTGWNSFVRTHNLHVEDHRPTGGALWVLGDTFPLGVTSQLQTWGFRPRAPRGWFKE